MLRIATSSTTTTRRKDAKLNSIDRINGSLEKEREGREPKFSTRGARAFCVILLKATKTFDTIKNIFLF